MADHHTTPIMQWCPHHEVFRVCANCIGGYCEIEMELNRMHDWLDFTKANRDHPAIVSALGPSKKEPQS